jgi:hypothetical protein
LTFDAVGIGGFRIAERFLLHNSSTEGKVVFGKDMIDLDASGGLVVIVEVEAGEKVFYKGFFYTFVFEFGYDGDSGTVGRVGRLQGETIAGAGYQGFDHVFESSGLDAGGGIIFCFGIEGCGGGYLVACPFIKVYIGYGDV